MADTLALALVLHKLLAKAFLRVGSSLDGIRWNFEVSLTMRADANGWHRPQPFDQPKIDCRHVLQFSTRRKTWLALGIQNCTCTMAETLRLRSRADLDARYREAKRDVNP